MSKLLSSTVNGVKKHIRKLKTGLSDDTSIHFLTFANTSYMKPTRILFEIQPFIFDTVTAVTELDIPEFIEKHKDFIEEYPRGYGFWIWKPKVILDKLLAVRDGDFIVYCDAGIHVNERGMSRYYDYLKLLNDPNSHILTFSANDFYSAQQWVKTDAVEGFFPDFYKKKYRYCYGGLMILKKTQTTIDLVTDWLALCENYHYIDASQSVSPNHKDFLGNDYDNGLFNLCLAKYDINTHIYPDETNLYDTNGRQAHMHVTDWSSLDAFPFQCRRLRPR